MKKRANSVGYFSAYYRGLECLLRMWPKIREEVPDATLDVYYGWESWIALEGQDDFYERMERKFADLASHGVTVHGRVSHGELARAMGSIQVWAYPTDFPEIHCITALKAQEAGCWPVCTTVAALPETVQCGDKIRTQRIYNDEYKQEQFIKAVVAALREGKTGTPVPNCDWSDVAQDWHKLITEKLHERKTSQTVTPRKPRQQAKTAV
jgi:glycosyltransferase involved in cell wall biosynthesis